VYGKKINVGEKRFYSTLKLQEKTISAALWGGRETGNNRTGGGVLRARFGFVLSGGGS